MSVTLGALAALIDGQLQGDGRLPITGANILRDALPGEITFAENARQATQLTSSQAAAVVAAPRVPLPAIPAITVADVPAAFARIVAHFRPPRPQHAGGVSSAAQISPTAVLQAGVTVYPFAAIGDDVTIGARSVIHAGVRIMAGSRLGADVIVFPNAVLYENTVVGDRSVIHANAVLGAHGFGFTLVDRRHRSHPQLGHVEIGADVTIGAGTTIDRGTYGATRVAEGTKIDNQVMIGHNCRIGRHNLIGAQVGIAGSVTTGDAVILGGQAGIRDHLTIGDRVRLGAKSGVMQDVPANATYLGIPATPRHQQRQIQAALRRLPELKKQLRELQRLVDELQAPPGGGVPEDAA